MKSDIIFEQIRSGGCLSYMVGSQKEKVCVVIDPEIDKTDEYLRWARELSFRLIYAIDTHTHADHSSACKVLREHTEIKVVMHKSSEAPYVDQHVEEGDVLQCGELSFHVFHTPGHTPDSTCLLLADMIFTGDTLLVGGCGRTDLPGGDAEKQYESLQKLVSLDDQLRIFPAHDYRPAFSKLGDEKKSNPRILIPSKEEFVRFMTACRPALARKIQEALEWNRSPIPGTQRGLGEGI